MPSHRGHTLIELLVTLALISILALLAVAPLLALRDGAAVRQEQQRLVETLDLARGAAVRLGTTTHLLLSDTSYLVTAVTVAGDSIVAWRGTGAARRSIQLSGTGAPLLFGPAGIAMGVSNRTITLRKGGAMKKVIVSRLGRVTQ